MAVPTATPLALAAGEAPLEAGIALRRLIAHFSSKLSTEPNWSALHDDARITTESLAPHAGQVARRAPTFVAQHPHRRAW